MMIRSLRLLAVSALLGGLAACGGGEEPAPAGTEPQTSQAPAAPSGPAPLTSRGGQPEGTESAPAGQIAFELPAGWQEQAPESGMRLAQAAVPGPGGPGQLAVFFFGPGGGGGVEDNLQRWIAQVEMPPGSQPARETFDVNGLKVTWVDVSGTVKPSTMGMGPANDQPNSRLFGAVVEGPGGPWFFKVTGPEATLAEQREAFLGMLRGIRLHQG